MRLPNHARRCVPIFGAIVAAGIALTPHVARADDGDEMCSKKGEIWVNDVETRSWENTFGACKPKGPNGPADGDKKCGIAGYTVKYVAKIDRWLNSHTPCHGGATPGVHLENLHTGTAAATPSGLGGDQVGSPGGM